VAVPYVTAADGVRLFYEVEGSGPPLVLHLGAGCDSELWRVAGYVAVLARTHQCILFDHRGHGRSDCPRGAEAHHIDRYAADVVALLDHLGLENAICWGYSNGIDVGLKIAHEYPSRLRALIGSGTTDDPDPQELPGLVERVLAAHQEHGWEQLIARFDKQEREPVPDWMKDRIRATDIGQLDDWLRALPTWDWAPWQALPETPVPTLFIVGELEDEDDTMATAASLMPNATRYRVPGQGHINAFLRSDLALPPVLEFLTKHAA
jgi:pimeloyl-ACP methyl ester carboxylesterase